MIRIVALILCLILMSGNARADAVFDMTDFAGLPVLEGGRLKPLGQFARVTLARLSGSDAPDGLSAEVWLATTLFDPVAAADQPVLQVPGAHLRAALALPDRPSHRYSLNELAPPLERQGVVTADLARKAEAGTLTPDEEALLTVHANVLLYNQLLQAFSLVLPLPGEATLTFLDAQKAEPELMAQVRAFLTPDLEANPDRLTPGQRALAARVILLKTLREGGNVNHLLRVIPPQWPDGTWLSPWQLVLDGQGSPAGANLLATWQKLATAWRTHDPALWQATTRALAGQRGDAAARLSVEELYHRLQPLLWAAVLYGAAVVALRWPRLSVGLLGAAVLAHGTGLGMRMLVLQRPPVGTLYESLLFVSLIVAAGGFWRTLRGGAAGLAAGLLLVAACLPGDAETLAPLTAVLNTRFWLSTHVLCITLGYGVCLLTALLAHGLLLVRGSAAARARALTQLHRLVLAALFFTATGTLLGGIWADQSWGRFWGWDPKENGALVIVLWLIWLLHARLAGQIGEQAWLAGLAALSVVVALAWFGVNLLSVGLHSYGFTDGIAGALAAFCLCEGMLIGSLWWWRARHGA